MSFHFSLSLQAISNAALKGEWSCGKRMNELK